MDHHPEIDRKRHGETPMPDLLAGTSASSPGAQNRRAVGHTNSSTMTQGATVQAISTASEL